MTGLDMAYQRLLISLLTVLTATGLGWIKPVFADLPPGNAIKDPSTILRNALPIEQKDLQGIQHKLEATTDAIRGNRWPALTESAKSSQFLLNRRSKKILETIPHNKEQEANILLNDLGVNLAKLIDQAETQNKEGFLKYRLESLKQIGELESFLLNDEFPYQIPEEFNELPRLLGRAVVSIKTNKGEMSAVIDGYNAPLTAGAFIDLSLKGFYDGLPINRAEDFYVLQSGDPKGPEIGYLDPKNGEERHVPLEIRVPDLPETLYNSTFEDVGLYKATPILPFATQGTLGWAHSEQAVDDGSSQFFIFLYEPELTPAGRNLIDGRNAAFGYVVEGFETLEKLGIDDQIVSIKVLDGANRLKPHA